MFCDTEYSRYGKIRLVDPNKGDHRESHGTGLLNFIICTTNDVH